MNSAGKIVWAVDPFLTEGDAVRASVLALRTILGASETTEILPLNVWRETKSEELSGVSELSFAAHRNGAQSRLDACVREFALRLLPLELVGKPFTSVSEGATALVRRAQRWGAEVIVLATHARKGPTRWFLGSFAETLSLLSEIPILIAPMHWQPRATAATGGNGPNVLFLTDFSDESRTAFEILIPAARARGWSLTLLHHVRFDAVPIADGAFTPWAMLEDAYRGETALRSAEGDRWVRFARDRGVSARVRIDDRREGSVDQLALTLLKRDHLFVALASRSGSVARALLGSVTQRLIQNSPVPVWVIHSPKVNGVATPGLRRPTGGKPSRSVPNRA